MIFPAAALARAKRGNFSRHEGAGRTHSVLAYICASLCRRALCALAAPRAGPYSYKYNASFVHAFIYIYAYMRAMANAKVAVIQWMQRISDGCRYCSQILIYALARLFLDPISLCTPTEYYQKFSAWKLRKSSNVLKLLWRNAAIF